MVEFKFDIRSLFPQSIVRISSSLLPHTFHGDRRQALDAVSKMSEIIDCLGRFSAVAQKLATPVTTAQKLRMSDNQVIYIMADIDNGPRGSVIGLLKIGTKDLYLFDNAGRTRKIDRTPCILDFYIHDSCQRTGLGKKLFETMLSEENWIPVKCSVDRPSEKLLCFLRKHYGLERTIPQANNFVLYDGFFESDQKDINSSTVQKQKRSSNMINNPNTQLIGDDFLDNDYKNRQYHRGWDSGAFGEQITQISPVGRYGARRPICSMAEIIHNSSNKGTETSRLS